MALTREEAAALDAADPLAGFRERFVITRPERIYLDGNSLGRLPKATRERVVGVLDEWGDRLVSGWEEWIDMPTRVGDALAEGVLGARPGEVIVSDSTTVNLFKLCSAALDAYRLSAQGAVVTDRDNFPTDRYVLEGLAEQRGLTLRMIDQPEDLEAVLSDGTVALVVLSHVNYRTGAVADLRELTDVARRYDAHIVWDLCHSAGALPVDLRENGIELAVGCTYKYLNGGPAPPPSSTRRRRSSRACAPRSRAGSASASSSTWTARTTRWTASAGSWPVRRRSTTWPPSRRACGSPPRPASGRCARSRSRSAS